MTNDYTSLEHSKRLQELGFKAGADMWWAQYNPIGSTGVRVRLTSDEDNIINESFGTPRFTPAFSLNTVLEALDKGWGLIKREKDWFPIFLATEGYMSDHPQFARESIMETSVELLIHTLEGKKT